MGLIRLSYGSGRDVEIRRLKSIITAAKLQDSDLLSTENALEENIHKKEEMVRVSYQHRI